MVIMMILPNSLNDVNSTEIVICDLSILWLSYFAKLFSLPLRQFYGRFCDHF